MWCADADAANDDGDSSADGGGCTGDGGCNHDRRHHGTAAIAPEAAAARDVHLLVQMLVVC